MAAVELGKLLARSTQISEQSAHRLCALDAYLRAEHGAVIECHSLQRETSAVHEVQAYVARLEKRSRHQAPTALGISLLASLADDLVREVAEPLAGCERTAALAVEHGHRVGKLTRLLLRLLASRIRPHAAEDSPRLKVEKLPQLVGLDRSESERVGNFASIEMKTAEIQSALLSRSHKVHESP